jgi:predicted RNA-binding Zn-ribbon protein involved in translation (DUF1610 family)
MKQRNHIRTSKKGKVFRAGRRKVRDYKYYNWIAAVLANDGISTNQELLRLFMEEGPMSREEAEFYVNQREEFNVFGLVRWGKKARLYERLGGKTIGIEVGGKKVEFIDENMCPDCGGTKWKREVKDLGEGDVAVYTCKNCGYENISIAEVTV